MRACSTGVFGSCLRLCAPPSRPFPPLRKQIIASEPLNANMRAGCCGQDLPSPFENAASFCAQRGQTVDIRCSENLNRSGWRSRCFRVRRARSLLRHACLTQPGEIGGFEQGAGLRYSPGLSLYLLQYSKTYLHRSACGLRRVRWRRVRSSLFRPKAQQTGLKRAGVSEWRGAPFWCGCAACHRAATAARRASRGAQPYRAR